MGQFSWLCSKCGKQITNMNLDDNGGGQAAVLVTPHGNFHERSYEGYGVFGGVDAFSWLAYQYGKISILCDEDHDDNDMARDLGIKLQFNPDFTPTRGIRIVHEECFHGDKYENLKNSEDDPNQGWIDQYDEEDY